MSILHERTLAIIKPDGVARGLIGEILSRFERKGLSLVGLKIIQATDGLAEQHYAEHKDKPFYPELLKFIVSGPIIVTALEGDSAIEVVRTLVGPTNGLKAPGGTIRGDFALSMQNNLIHASDSVGSAKKELELWFKTEDLLERGRGSGSAAQGWTNSEEHINAVE